MQRTGEQFKAILKSVVAHLNKEGTIRHEGNFLWPNKPSFHLNVRFPHEENTESFREVEHIAPEEIGLALQRLVRDGMGISRDALIREAARLFGFRRPNNKVRGAFDRVLRTLITQGILVRDGTKVYEPR
jgi:hypothetical protein